MRAVLRFRVCVAAGLSAALIGLVGCQDQAKRVEVAGTVTYKGEPLTAGTVAFYPEGSGDEPARGVIGRDGRYRMTELLPGRYIVTVTPPPPPPNGKKAMTLPGRPTPVYIPAKFSKKEQSHLTIEVAGQNLACNIPLVD